MPNPSDQSEDPLDAMNRLLREASAARRQALEGLHYACHLDAP